MTDVVDKTTRSRMMAGIRGKDTKPELRLRKALFARGLRYRLHRAGMPGRPDLVFPRYRCVVFVHGCFWHRHSCARFRFPASNPTFWRTKIERNVERDENVIGALQSSGWRVAVVWECALMEEGSRVAFIAGRVERWLVGRKVFLEIPASWAP